MGWWPVKIIAVLNVIEQLGWSSVGCKNELLRTMKERL